jgi:hypothetical protein
VINSSLSSFNDSNLLSDDQKTFFDEQGYLVVENALPPETDSALDQAIDAFRWVKPMDYITMPDALLSRATPIQKQLLGAVSDPLSYYLPRDEDVPLKAMVEKN